MSFLPESRQPDREDRLTEIRRRNIVEILSGRHRGLYSEWTLTGRPGQNVNPIITLAIVPSSLIVPDLIFITFIPFPKKTTYYCSQISRLLLPPRIQTLEDINYQQYCESGITGEEMLAYMSQETLAPYWPSSLVLFNQSEDGIESVVLITLTLIPPSTALNQISQQARDYLTRLN